MEEEKQAHSKRLAQHYMSQLRNQLLPKYRGEWIVMRSMTEYDLVSTAGMDEVYSKDWSYWDEYGCFYDCIGAEECLFVPLLS